MLIKRMRAVSLIVYHDNYFSSILVYIISLQSFVCVFSFLYTHIRICISIYICYCHLSLQSIAGLVTLRSLMFRSRDIGCNTLLWSPQPLIWIFPLRRSALSLSFVLDHLSCSIVVSWNVDLFDTEENVSKSSKLTTLQWLGKVIRDHIQCQAVLHIPFLCCNSVGDKEVSNVDEACSLPTRSFPILS